MCPPPTPLHQRCSTTAWSTASMSKQTQTYHVHISGFLPSVCVKAFRFILTSLLALCLCFACRQVGTSLTAQGSCTVSARWPLLQGSCIWLCLSSILCADVCLCVWISCWLTVLCRCNADAAVLLHANTGFLLCNFEFRADRQVNVAAGRKWLHKFRVTVLICRMFLEIKSNLQLL